jgi:hypothetical protein
MAQSLTKLPRILFFIKGTVPTLEQQLEAEDLAPARVAFRNANLVLAEGSLEVCDGVTGDVPKRYKDAYPTAKKALEGFAEARKAAYEKLAKDADAAAKSGLDATAAAAAKKAEAADKAKAKTDEAAAKAKADADAKAKAAAAWKPNA